MLVILQNQELGIHQLPFRGVRDRKVGLVLAQNLVFQAVVVNCVGFKIEFSVSFLQSRKPVVALVEFALGCKADFAGVFLQIRNGLDVVLVGDRFQNHKPLGIVRGRIVEPYRLEFRFVFALYNIIDLFGVGHQGML